MNILSPIAHWTNWEIAPRTGGGGGGGTTTSTNYTSSLPEYAEPYYLNLMETAQQIAQAPYIPYGQPRIAGYNTDQLSAMLGIQNLAATGLPGMQTAADFTGTAGASYGEYKPYYQSVGTYQNLLPSSYSPTTYGGHWINPANVTMYGGPSDYQSQQIDIDKYRDNMRDFVAADIDPYLLGLDVRFTPEWRDYYMSPYMDSVTEYAKDQALEDHQRQQAFRNTAAVNAGAFGGSRQAVGDYLAEEGLLDRMKGIDVEGRQSAFENAQMQFERDRANITTRELANQQAIMDAERIMEMSRQFGYSYEQAINEMLMRGEMSNQQADLAAAQLRDSSSQFYNNLNMERMYSNQADRLYAQQLQEGSRQFGAQYGLDWGQLGTTIDSLNQQADLQAQQNYLTSLQGMLSAGRQMGDLSIEDQNAYLDRMNALYGQGAEQQRLDQYAYDLAYQDFLNQRDYDMNTIQWLSSILHGVPIEMTREGSTTAPPPNPYSQLGGLGLAGLGLYKYLS